MKRAILIKPLGYVEPYALREDDELHQMQCAVGGLIQLVSVNIPNLSFFCNEDGIAKELEYNELASAVCSYGFEGRYTLLGNVLVMGGVDGEGETQGLTAKQVNIFLQAEPNLLDQLING